MRWHAKRRCGFLVPALLIGIAPNIWADNHIENKTILSGDTFTLSDGRIIKLEFIRGPMNETPDLQKQAHAEIEKLVSG